MQPKQKAKPRLLLTGASGFLGGHIAQRACDQFEVYATYFRHRFSLQGISILALDITEELHLRLRLDHIRPDVVIHAAALSNPEYCEEHLQEAEAVNVNATACLAKWCGSNGARVIYVSSDMAFDGDKGYYRESDPTNPINFYGLTKVSGEEETRRYCANYVIARAALIYGRPITGGSSFSDWIENRLKENQVVPLFYDQFRTPILVQNLAAALLELAANDFVGTIHLGGSERIDRYSFATKFAKLGRYNTSLLENCSMTEIQFKAHRPRDVSFNVEKAKQVLRTELLSVDNGVQKIFQSESPGQD